MVWGSLSATTLTEMDVIFETQKGVSFTIEIGYFDTVLEIKEKIHKYRDIPVSNQTLLFNGKTLENDGNVEICFICHNSRMSLVVEPENTPEITKEKFEEHESQSPISKKTQLLCRLPNSKSHLSLEMDLNDSVLLLKERLHELNEGVPTNRLALYVNGNNELQDHRCLREYELTDGSEIDVTIRPSLTPNASAMANTVSTTGSKKLKIVVIPKSGPKKVPLEVNPTEKVQVLRNELEKAQQKVNFQLPPEGYFFIYKQTVMEERESFLWHNVRNGDAIEIFNGSVTGGS